MIRVNMGAQGLGRLRFAVSPLDTAMDLLFTLGQNPGALQPRWRVRAVETLRQRRLGLLAVVTGGGPNGYVPDFPRPEPAGFHTDVDAGLHRVATAPVEQVGYELTVAVNGHAWDGSSARKAPRLLLAAMEQGEAHVAERLAGELAQFWHAVLAPERSRVRAALEGDVNMRAISMAQSGVIDTVNGLAPNLEWSDGALNIRLPSSSPHRFELHADAAILVPSVFAKRAVFCRADIPGAATPRPPRIVYPVGPGSPAPASDGQLIGATRARVLAELALPCSTAELAERLYLSPATVSYHLQILHRAGRVQRTRSSHRVLYQRSPA